MLLILLLAETWAARGEPPGQISTGAAIHFGEDSATQYDKASNVGVKGLHYFATSGSQQLPGLQQPLLVYPGSVLRAGPLLIPTQVGIQNVAGGDKGIPYYGYFVSSSPTPEPPATLPPPLPPPLPSPPSPSYTNVDLTYDSLSLSSSLNGASYSPPIYTTPAPFPATRPILTSPPPMQATTYGPPKPVVLRPYLTTKHRGTFVLGPPHHHLTLTKAVPGHYHQLIPVSPKHIHAGHPPAFLVKSKPHPYPITYTTHNPQHPKTPPSTIYGPPARIPHISPPISLSHPDITKAIFHPQPEDSYAAAAALSSSQTNGPYPTNPPATYNLGTASVLTQPYYIPLIPYASVFGPHERSDETELLQSIEKVAHEGIPQGVDVDQEHNREGELEEQASPVLMYKGVRPPVTVYQKPQSPVLPKVSKPMELQNEMIETGNILSSDSRSAVSSPSWTPINAPEGAVPARAYEIPAPDLSQGNSHMEEADEEQSQLTDYFPDYTGKVSSVPFNHRDWFSSQTDSDIRQKDLYKENSEEVVSAVVLVKQ